MKTSTSYYAFDSSSTYFNVEKDKPDEFKHGFALKTLRDLNVYFNAVYQKETDESKRDRLVIFYKATAQEITDGVISKEKKYIPKWLHPTYDCLSKFIYWIGGIKSYTEQVRELNEEMQSSNATPTFLDPELGFNKDGTQHVVSPEIRELILDYLPLSDLKALELVNKAASECAKSTYRLWIEKAKYFFKDQAPKKPIDCKHYIDSLEITLKKFFGNKLPEVKENWEASNLLDLINKLKGNSKVCQEILEKAILEDWPERFIFAKFCFANSIDFRNVILNLDQTYLRKKNTEIFKLFLKRKFLPTDLIRHFILKGSPQLMKALLDYDKTILSARMNFESFGWWRRKPELAVHYAFRHKRYKIAKVFLKKDRSVLPVEYLKTAIKLKDQELIKLVKKKVSLKNAIRILNQQGNRPNGPLTKMLQEIVRTKSKPILT